MHNRKALWLPILMVLLSLVLFVVMVLTPVTVNFSGGSDSPVFCLEGNVGSRYVERQGA